MHTRRPLALLHRGLMWVAVVTGILMMVHVTTDVIARGIFRHPLPGVGEITASYYMVAVAFLPLAWVSYRDTHIRTDLFTHLMPRPLVRVSDFLAEALSLVYFALVGWQGVLGAIKATHEHEFLQIMGGYVAIWPARWLVPVAMFAMLLSTLLRVWDRQCGTWPGDRGA